MIFATVLGRKIGMLGRKYRHRTMIREMKDGAYEPIRSVTVVDFGTFT